MTRYALILALLLPLGATYHPQYVPSAHFPTTTVFNPCLISGWPMNEGSSTILHDVSSNSNTVTGATVVWQSNAGLPGITAFWNTSTGTSTNAALTNFSGTTPFSLSFWVNPVAQPGTYFGTIDSSNGFKGWEVSQDGTNILKLLIINTFPGNRLDVTAPLTINTGVHYAVVTYDGSQSSSGVKMYVDGVSQTVSVTANTLSATAASGLPITFGQRASSLGLTGAMAFVGIYNCVLTSTQVATFNGLGPRIN